MRLPTDNTRLADERHDTDHLHIHYPHLHTYSTHDYT